MKRYNWLLVLALVFNVALAGSEAGAQAPAKSPPNKIYTREKFFALPIVLDEKERAALQQIQLYVKDGPNEPWVLKERVLPTQDRFVYRVPQDGEYWFGMAVVDKSGKATPADINQLLPSFIVVVDTQAPELLVRTLPATSKGVCVECKVRDANPDPARLRVEYQSADKTWQMLQPLADDPSVFLLPGPVVPESVVRVAAIDRAGNVSVRIVNLASESADAAPPPVAPIAPAGPYETHAEKIPLMPPEPAPAAPTRQIINGTHASLEYKIEQQGPSGISKIEVWVTSDESATWRRLCEDSKHQGPVEFDLPGEGVFGISLVVTNGAGIAGTPPAKGDAPDYWVEVDQTKPAAQLVSVRPGNGEEIGIVQINWTASDKNLGATPIDLYYATDRTGPWQPIATGLKNEGSYRWTVAHDVGSRVFVRLEATDRAGNQARCDYPEPVVLDPVRPKARVVKVTARPSAAK